MEAAAQLEIDQAQVSKLLAGQMAGFSIERLVHFLSLLGQDVEVTVRKAPHGGGVGQCGRGLPGSWIKWLGSLQPSAQNTVFDTVSLLRPVFL